MKQIIYNFVHFFRKIGIVYGPSTERLHWAFCLRIGHSEKMTHILMPSVLFFTDLFNNLKAFAFLYIECFIYINQIKDMGKHSFKAFTNSAVI